MLMENSLHSLLQSELSAGLEARVATLNHSEVLAGVQTDSALSLMRLLGERALICDLVLRDPPTSWMLLNVHAVHWLATRKAAAAVELVLHQLHTAFPLLEQLGAQSSLANSLSIQLLRGETLVARIIHSLDLAATISARKNGDGWLIQGELPVCLVGPDTQFILLPVASVHTGKLDIFLLPCHADAVRIVSRAPVSGDENYALAHINLANVQLKPEFYLGNIARESYQHSLSTHQALSAVTNNQSSKMTLTATIEFLRNRLVNGTPLLKLDVLQQRLAALQAELSMSQALAYSTLYAQRTETFSRLANASYEAARKLHQTITAECLHLGGINHYRTDSELANSYQQARWMNFFSEFSPATVLAR